MRIRRDFDGRCLLIAVFVNLHPPWGALAWQKSRASQNLANRLKLLTLRGLILTKAPRAAARPNPCKFGEADRRHAFAGWTRTLPSHTMPTSPCSRGSANEKMSIRLELLLRWCLSQLHARAASPADSRKIDQSSVRETAPDRRKSFPWPKATMRARAGAQAASPAC